MVWCTSVKDIRDPQRSVPNLGGEDRPIPHHAALLARDFKLNLNQLQTSYLLAYNR